MVCVDWLGLSQKIVKTVVDYCDNPLLVVNRLLRVPPQGEHEMLQVVKHYLRLFKKLLVKGLIGFHMFIVLFPRIDLRSRLHPLRCIVFIVFESYLVLHELE
jgi:hypothetical protein